MRLLWKQIRSFSYADMNSKVTILALTVAVGLYNSFTIVEALYNTALYKQLLQSRL